MQYSHFYIYVHIYSRELEKIKCLFTKEKDHDVLNLKSIPKKQSLSVPLVYFF